MNPYVSVFAAKRRSPSSHSVLAACTTRADSSASSAMANAIYDATGVRLRQGPFTPDRLRAGLA